MNEERSYQKVMNMLRESNKFEKLSFTKESLFPAANLRTTGQKRLYEKVEEETVLGVLIHDEVKLSLLKTEVLESIIDAKNYYKEQAELLEEIVEEENLGEKYGERLTTPPEQWNERPANMSMKEWYHLRKRDNEKGI